MKKFHLICLFLLWTQFLFSQVGINTTTPSAASVLDVNSSSDGISFGGFMPPVLSSIADRNSINPSLSDIGLLIFLSDAVNSNYCLQIWNGGSWEDVYCINSPSIIDIASQDFDSNQTWTYTESPAFYYVVDDIWDIVNSLTNITGFSGNFLGCRDLDNPNGGGNFNHSLTFDNVNVSAYSNVQVLFDYDVFEFDAGDEVYYEVFYEDISQGVVHLIDGVNGVGGVSETGTVTVSVPGGTINVRLSLEIIQDGNGDMAGFDDFKIIGL